MDLLLWSTSGRHGLYGCAARYPSDTTNGSFRFERTPPPSASITVTSPNGGEIWNKFENHNIRWIASGLPLDRDTVDITLLHWDGYQWELEEFIANDLQIAAGSYNWPIPDVPTPSYFKIRIKSFLYPSIEDTSDTSFVIGWMNTGEWFTVHRGTDNHLYFNKYTQSTNTWTGWNSIGGTTYDEPAVAYTGNNCVHVVIRGTDYALYYKKLNLNTNTWDASWTSLGGRTSSAPTLLSWSSSQLDGDPAVLPYLWLAVRGIDNHLYLKRWTPATGWDITWQSWGGTTYDRPALALWYDNETSKGIVTLGVRGTDNRVYIRDYAFASGDSGSMGPWKAPGGSILSPPVIFYKNSYLRVAVRGTDNHIYCTSFGGSVYPLNYEAFGGTTYDMPVVCNWPDWHAFEISVRGADSRIYAHDEWSSTNWDDMAIKATGHPTFSCGGVSTGMVAVRGADNGIYFHLSNFD